MNRANAHLHDRSTRRPLVSDSRKPCPRRTAWDLAYRSMYMCDIPYRAHNRSLAVEASEDRFQKMEMNQITADSTVFPVNIHSQYDSSSDELKLRYVERVVIIPGNMQAAVLVSSQGGGLVKIETHSKFVEQRGSMTAQSLMDTLPGKPCHFYILSMAAKLATLPKFMIVS